MKQLSVRRRSGSVLVTALVCLVIVMALVGYMLVGALRNGRQTRVERDRRQCEYLLQAGIDLAARRLAGADPYDGEVWDVPAAEILGIADGQVTISVGRSGAEPPRIRVRAEYPLGSVHSICRSRSFRFTSTNPLPQE